MGTIRITGVYRSTNTTTVAIRNEAERRCCGPPISCSVVETMERSIDIPMVTGKSVSDTRETGRIVSVANYSLIVVNETALKGP